MNQSKPVNITIISVAHRHIAQEYNFDGHRVTTAVNEYQIQYPDILSMFFGLHSCPLDVFLNNGKTMLCLDN
jgi:hypothetical protein